MAKKKLNAGKGAEGTILTRFIHPKQPLPDGSNPNHRSNVIVEDRYSEDDKWYYRLRYFDDEPGLTSLYAHHRYVAITKEGDKSLFFDEQQITKGEEPKIKWSKSTARRLLYRDVKEGMVSLEQLDDPSIDQIYIMHPQYAEYSHAKFPGRLKSIQNTITKLNSRAEDDQKSFDLFVKNNEISYHNSKGFIQWQGSEAQSLLLEDINDGTFKTYGSNKKDFYGSRPEYYNNFILKDFRDKIKQEISTAKYLHTIETKGKMHKSS